MKETPQPKPKETEYEEVYENGKVVFRRPKRIIKKGKK
jgi:hypothetical protein